MHSFLQNWICWILFGTLTIIFDVLEENIGKIIESRYIGIWPIIDKIIDIGRRLPQIIGDFRELSAKLLISKMAGKLSKIYRYRKKWLIAHPYFRQTQEEARWHNFTEFTSIDQTMSSWKHTFSIFVKTWKTKYWNFIIIQASRSGCCCICLDANNRCSRVWGVGSQMEDTTRCPSTSPS